MFLGSFTTPPFTEGIKWILFSPLEVIGLTITSSIYNIFTSECHNNSFRTDTKSKVKVYFRQNMDHIQL